MYEKRVVEEDIPPLSKAIKRRVRNSIEQKLTTKPEIFGKPLRASLKSYWSLRVGEYRVIYTIQSIKVTIFVIGHRSKVYK